MYLGRLAFSVGAVHCLCLPASGSSTDSQPPAVAGALSVSFHIRATREGSWEFFSLRGPADYQQVTLEPGPEVLLGGCLSPKPLTEDGATHVPAAFQGQPSSTVLINSTRLGKHRVCSSRELVSFVTVFQCPQAGQGSTDGWEPTAR